jgi:aspartyl-tRNA(Asn)/glutamyl-tRNA(Gln) amidotransferase subunit C
MSIQLEEIQKLATLSRLSIDEKTITEVSNRLSSVLALVDQLQSAEAVDTDAARPFHYSQRLRDDVVTEIDQRDILQSIAPETHNGLFSVPKMIE